VSESEGKTFQILENFRKKRIHFRKKNRVSSQKRLEESSRELEIFETKSSTLVVIKISQIDSTPQVRFDANRLKACFSAVFFLFFL